MPTPATSRPAAPTDLVTVTLSRSHAAQMAHSFAETAGSDFDRIHHGGQAQALAAAYAAAVSVGTVPITEDAKWLKVAREELARVDAVLREGLTVWPKEADRVAFARWCIARRIALAGGTVERDLAPQAVPRAAREAVPRGGTYAELPDGMPVGMPDGRDDGPPLAERDAEHRLFDARALCAPLADRYGMAERIQDRRVPPPKAGR